jgi:HK97 family phage portal protein
MRLRDVALRIIGGKKDEQRAIDSVPWDVGGPTRPSTVSADQALGLVPVFAAVRLLASQVASLPLQAYRKTGDTRARIASPALFVHPSVQGTLYDWLHRCVTSLALRGNAYGLITQRDRDQYPTMVEWLHPDDVFVDDRQASGPGSFTNPTWYWQGRIIPAEDLIHIPWFTVPGRVQGLSPIGACAATISTGISAQNYTADWFDNGAVPPGEFRNTAKTINQDEADIISARLTAAIRRRRPLVYGNDWEYKPISVSAHEAKFVETLKMNATQVAAIYGIPPEMIGGEAGGPLTYNTVEQNSLNFLKFTLRPWLELLEGAFYRLTPRPQYVKFNIDGLLRSDLTTRMSAYTTSRNIGLNNIDEIRALEDLPPLPNGRGQDYTPLEILAKQAGPQPVQARADWDMPTREAEVVRWLDTYRLSGTEALRELIMRRADPASGDAGPKVLSSRKFNPLQPRDPHSGEWIGDGGVSQLADIGHAVFAEVESANSVDQVVEGFRRHKAEHPDVSVDDLILGADAAIEAKYPPDKHPNIKGFYSKLLADRRADIDKPAQGTAKKKPAIRPKSAPAPSDHPAVTARQAQAMQDGMPPPWTGDQRKALRYYTGNSAVANGLLRGWIKPPGKTASDQKKIEAAQRNIEHAKAAMRPSTQAILVRRTAGPEQFGVATTKELHDLVGHAMIERGFMSTTTKRNAGIGGKVKMEIEVPAGTPMAFVKSVSKYDYEDEVLLAPGLKYTVLSVTGSSGRPTVRIRVEPT